MWWEIWLKLHLRLQQWATVLRRNFFNGCHKNKKAKKKTRQNYKYLKNNKNCKK